MYKLVDSKKCRLQAECRPLFSGFENNGTTVASQLSWLERRTGILFLRFLRNCINRVHNCEDHSSFDFISAVLIYHLFHMHLSMGLLLSRSHLHGENNVLH